MPNEEGDISKIKINNKKINLIDESYNSNPLSLDHVLNFDKINTEKNLKISSTWRYVGAW